jgi:hypothetical protein
MAELTPFLEPGDKSHCWDWSLEEKKGGRGSTAFTGRLSLRQPSAMVISGR